LEEPGAPMLVTLSGGTVHKPPPLDAAGFPVTEAVAAAKYLMSKGCNAQRIVTESFSRDTVGNAYFARVIHTAPAGYRRLLVVTSDFHMPRVKSIFEHVFQIDSDSQPYQLHFASTPDIGYQKDAWKGRRQREAKSLARWNGVKHQLNSLRLLHHWLFTQHSAYAVDGQPEMATDDALQTY